MNIPKRPKRSGLRVIEEGNSDFCSICGSTMQKRFRLFGGLFQFGKVLYCHNRNCTNLTTQQQR